MCGLLKRETLEDIDIGFAYLPQFAGLGHGLEAANAILDWGRKQLRLKRVVAIVSTANRASIGLLGKLGFAHEGERLLDAGKDPVELFGIGF